jgi:HAD superfamily hydrolase (TIGR01509 family)
MDVAAVIFDMDGVIIESELLWDRAREELVTAAGGRWLEDSDTAMMGMAAPEWSAYMRDHLRVPLTAEQINARVVERLSAFYRERLPLIDGAVAAVRAAAARWPVAIASSSDRELIDLVTDLAGLAGVLGATVSSEEAGRGKPAPDVFLRAAELLGTEPERCVAIEDSANGIRAARAAGMPVVAMPSRDFPPAASLLAEAAVVVDGPAEITPELIERAGGSIAGRRGER